MITLLSVFLMTFVGTADAQVLKLRKTTWRGETKNLVEGLTLKGDFRLRHDNSSKRSGGQKTRSRFRTRLRFEALVDLPENLRVGLRLASGSGSQVSTNQSFDNLGSGKGLVIDRIYLQWKPRWATLSFGKIKNPLWSIASSDIVFDTDLNPEGFGQQLEWGNVSLNALQMVVDEDFGSEAQQWLFSQQLAATLKLPKGFDFAGGASWHEWVNERFSTLGQKTTLEGNRRVPAGPGAGSLANDFAVFEFSGELSRTINSLPVRLQGSFIKNTSALSVRSNAGDASRYDLGYHFGTIVGKASAARSWEAAYFYKWLETDATVADAADADFGDGGTNRRGHIFWLAYNPRDWMQLKAKFFVSSVIDENLAPGADDINRVLLDVALRF
ncbi:MAG: hypothetical protein COB53_12120 [Elusimicrobia bacterium]|nr:MAG: hypothetical protein COB53_12120 [Elusimicrobiota bacterium]